MAAEANERISELEAERDGLGRHLQEATEQLDAMQARAAVHFIKINGILAVCQHARERLGERHRRGRLRR